MKNNLSRTIRMCLLPLCCLAILTATGCGSGSQSENTGAAGKATIPKPSGVNTARDTNACHLLTHEEVSALVEEKIVMADQVEADQTSSTCQWENASGTALFTLTVHWANGKQEWETWRVAQGLGNQLFKQVEGVRADDVVNQGPVAGLGDAAYFSEALPSLVLKGDILFEMNLNFVPHAETRFASLARKLLAKVE